MRDERAVEAARRATKMAASSIRNAVRLNRKVGIELTVIISVCEHRRFGFYPIVHGKVKRAKARG